MFSVRTSAAYALSQSGAEAKAFVLFILTITTQLMANWLARSQLILPDTHNPPNLLELWVISFHLLPL